MNQQCLINDIISKAKADLQEYTNTCKQSRKKLCDLKLSYRDNDSMDYGRLEIQSLYILKYFYAYLLEYKSIYDSIGLDHYNVLSVGCGAYIDLLGLLLSHPQKTVSYYGVDKKKWFLGDFVKERCGLMDKISFFEKDFVDFLKDKENENTMKKINVIIFPKSIEYMDSSEWKNLFPNIDFQEKEMFLVMNAMDRDFDMDESKLDYLKDLFTRKGYEVKGEIRKSLLAPKYYIQFPGSPEYPHEIRDNYLPNLWNECYEAFKCGKTDSCYLHENYEPMVKTDSFHFKIWKLVKKEASDDHQC